MMSNRKSVEHNWTELYWTSLYDINSTHIACLNLNNVNQLIFVMVKYGVLFEVRTEFLNKI
jgi:hypothetical protein